MEKLIEPLKGEFGIDCLLSWKDDPDGMFHARHLHTDATCVHLDRGFDLFRADSSWMRNLVKCGRSDRDHLAECQMLPKA
jgi:hypothetical protein